MRPVERVPPLPPRGLPPAWPGSPSHSGGAAGSAALRGRQERPLVPGASRGSSLPAAAAMALKMVKGSIDRMFDKNLQDLVRGIRNHKEDEVSPWRSVSPVWLCRTLSISACNRP